MPASQLVPESENAVRKYRLVVEAFIASNDEQIAQSKILIAETRELLSRIHIDTHYQLPEPHAAESSRPPMPSQDTRRTSTPARDGPSR